MMSILGIESIIFGVEDIAESVRFWDDYGLTMIARDDSGAEFEVESGSRVIIRDIADPTLPPAYFPGPGVRETVFGVDTPKSLEALVAGLATDREVRRDPDGTAHFIADDGTPLALRVWNKRPVVSQPDPVNAPGNIQRLNLHRKWRLRARPKTINHIVYYSDDYVASWEFYRDRLGFRLSDHSKGLGIFARADGTHEHHTAFWVSTNLKGTKGKLGYVHVAFGLEDIDELMLGANYMADKGWTNDRNFTPGLNRHRVSSAMYYYFPCPSGGEAEYHVDTDYIDDNWIPRCWDVAFGSFLWSSVSTGMHRDGGTNWDVTLDPDGRSIEAYRQRKKDAAE